VTSDGLTITGRGKTVVTTPGDYESGQQYRVDRDGGAATVRPRVVRADEDGCLTFAVHLGPAAETGSDVANQPESATIRSNRSSAAVRTAANGRARRSIVKRSSSAT